MMNCYNPFNKSNKIVGIKKKRNIFKYLFFIFFVGLVGITGVSVYFIFTRVNLNKNNVSNNNSIVKIIDKPIMNSFNSDKYITSSSKFKNDWDAIENLFFSTSLEKIRLLGASYKFITYDYETFNKLRTYTSWSYLISSIQKECMINVKITLPKNYVFIDNTNIINSNYIVYKIEK